MRLHNDAYFFIKRQFMYLGAGVVLAVLVSLFDYHKWRDWEFLTWACFVVVMVLLAAVFQFRAINGSHRWIAVGPVRIQPSELAKMLTVILLAVWLDKASWRVELFMRGAFWPAVLIGIIALPVLLEPDPAHVAVCPRRCRRGGVQGDDQRQPHGANRSVLRRQDQCGGGGR